MEFKGVMGGFYRITEWIMRFSVTNVLWVICSLPVFFIALLIFTPDITPDIIYTTMMLIAIVAPFTMFPATSAMFAVARKWVTGDEDVPLLKTFFRSYKENYLQSMLGGIILVILGALLFLNYRFYISQEGTLRFMSVLFITFGFIFSVSLFNFFSIIAHLHMKLFQVIKNSILITIGQPIRSMLIIVTNGFIVYISFKFNFLIPFFMGSLIAYMSFWHFNAGFNKMQEKHEKLMQKNEKKDESDLPQFEERTDENSLNDSR